MRGDYEGTACEMPQCDEKNFIVSGKGVCEKCPEYMTAHEDSVRCMFPICEDYEKIGKTG